MAKKTKITPWEVEGEFDYRKLVKEFGTQPLTEDLKNRFTEFTKKEEHLFLRRNIFFSHRDFDKILDDAEQGKEIALYTGRGPSGNTHLGHLFPWIFTKYLQDVFDCELYFEITNDEKMLVKDMTLQETTEMSYENALDLIALGFNPKKTKIFLNTEYIKTLYPIALDVAKRITFSISKGVFGFGNNTNIGLIFFPALQASVSFLPSKLKGKNIRVLIPAAIDQDPYWRGIARHVAEKIGYLKPAQIHNIFLPGLEEGGKMSSSNPNSAIYTTDSSKTAEKKIMRAFTGGQPTVEEQREKGGNTDICIVYKYLHYLFEEDDNLLVNRKKDCRSGKLLCGECKKYLAGKVCVFLEEHQKKRELAKKQLDKFIVKD